MGCESCAVAFSVWRRRRACGGCARGYCAACLRRGGGVCASCRALSTRPLARAHIAHLKARDLQAFLQGQNVSTRGCVEKEDLISLCLSHVNSGAYRRQAPRSTPGPFTTLKGLTSNINEFINNAFDLRPTAFPAGPGPTTATPAPTASASDRCHNSSSGHTAHAPPPVSPTHPSTSYIHPSSPHPSPPSPPLHPPSASSDSESPPLEVRVDTADCFEIEDLDDAGWELVERAVEPLPNDSEVLLTINEQPRPSPTRPTVVVEQNESTQDMLDTAPAPAAGASDTHGTLDGLRPVTLAQRLLESEGSALSPPQRAASERDLRCRLDLREDTRSLHDEPLPDLPAPAATAAPIPPAAPVRRATAAAVQLEEISCMAALEELSARQLKELLYRNRVEFRGCVEKADLLQRARTLWRDHRRYRDQLENLPLEECCKICMAAPLECVLLECGHMATCTACAKQLAECPICRQFVVRAVRFFRS